MTDYKLLFEDSRGALRDLKEFSAIDEDTAISEAMRSIRVFLDEHDYKSFYTRYYKETDGRVVFDVGSWSEFFHLVPQSTEG